LDYLAEVTMSIVQKQKQADPNLGYARDFPPLIGRIARKMRERNVKVMRMPVASIPLPALVKCAGLRRTQGRCGPGRRPLSAHR
jgi:hypothetical protein